MSISRKHRHRTTRGLTLVEVLVLILIISVLLAVLLPVFQKAVGIGTEFRCAANLRQLGIAFSSYSADNSGYLLPLLTVRKNLNTGGTDSLPWNRLLILDHYLARNPNWNEDRTSIFSCPARSTAAWAAGDQCHYGYSHYPGFYPSVNYLSGEIPKRLVVMANPSQTLLLAEISSAYRFVPWNLATTQGMTVVYPHRRTLNALYADGSVRKLNGPLPTAPFEGPAPQFPYY